MGVSRADAHHGEDAESRRVHQEQAQVEQRLIPHQDPPHLGEEHHQRGQHRHRGVDGVLKGGGRRVAQDQVPDDAAAHGGGQPQDADAEDVHVFPQPRHGAGGGKGHGADELQDQDENIQRIHGGFLTAPRTGPSP